MEVRIQSIHFDASEQLQAFVQKKAVKLEKYYDDIKKVEVSLKVVKPETAENKEAGIKVIIPNGEFYASKICDTFEEAIDLSVEALEKQLVKHKDLIMKSVRWVFTVREVCHVQIATCLIRAKVV